MGPPMSYFMSPGLCFLTWLYAHAGQRSYLATSGAQRESGVSLSSWWIHLSGLMRNTEQFLSLLGRSSGCLNWLCQWKSTWKRPAAALNATSAPHPTPTMEAGSTPMVRAEPGGSYPEPHARHRGDVILGALSWRLSPGSCLALGVEAGSRHLGPEPLCQEPTERSLICWIIVSGSGAEQSLGQKDTFTRGLRLSQGLEWFRGGGPIAPPCSPERLLILGGPWPLEVFSQSCCTLVMTPLRQALWPPHTCLHLTCHPGHPRARPLPKRGGCSVKQWAWPRVCSLLGDFRTP